LIGVRGDLLATQQELAAFLAEVERRAEGKERLDWPDSIVDLLKALGRDSSFEARRQLAGELGRTNYSGTAEENIWLHSRVMEKVRRREW